MDFQSAVNETVMKFAFHYDSYPASFGLRDAGPECVKSLLAAYIISNRGRPGQRFYEKRALYLHSLDGCGFQAAPCFDPAAVLERFARTRPFLGEVRKFSADFLDLLRHNLIDPANSVQTMAFVRDLIRDRHPVLNPVLDELGVEIKMNHPFPARPVIRPTDPSAADCRDLDGLKRRLRDLAPAAQSLADENVCAQLSDLASAWRKDLTRLFHKGLRMIATDMQAVSFCGLYSAFSFLALEHAFQLVFPSGAGGFLLARSMKNIGSDLDYIFIGRPAGADFSIVERFLQAMGFCLDRFQRRRVSAELLADRLSDHSLCYLLHMDFRAGDKAAYHDFCGRLFQRLDERGRREGFSFGESVLRKHFAGRLAAWTELERSFFAASPAAALSIKRSAVRAVEDIMLALRFQAGQRGTGDPVGYLRLKNGIVAAEDAATVSSAYDKALWFRNCLHAYFGYNYNELHPRSLGPALRPFGLSAEEALQSLRETADALNRVVRKYFPKPGLSINPS